MKKNKLFLYIALCLTILIPSLTATVFASETQYATAQVDLIQEGTLPTPTSAEANPTLLSAEQDLDAYLYEALNNVQTAIDVQKFSLNVDASTLSDAYERVVNGHPELFYVSGGYSYYSSGNIVTCILPTYTMSGETLTAARASYSSALNGILAQVDENWSDLETVLFFNDYLSSHYEYDTTYSIYDAYNFLQQGTGVCQAYYLTCRALLNACDIPSLYARSDKADHIWNLVLLNGNWYHLDVTWNDPIPDSLGAARHTYFLLSTDALLTLDSDRTDWVREADVTCTDQTYDQYYWKNVTSPFVALNGKWYYSDSEGIRETSDPTIPGTTVIYHRRWPVIGNSYSYWNGAFSGLGVYKNWLVYNTCNEVIGYDPKTQESRTLYETTTDDRDIYGIVVGNGSASCELATSPNDANGVREMVSLELLNIVIKKDTVKEFSGIKICEGDGLVSIIGNAPTGEDFFIMAAGYTEDRKMCDFWMIRSSELESTITQWQLEGKTFKLFLVSTDYHPVD